MDCGRDRRRGRCALHRAGQYRAGVPTGADRDDPDAGVDRQFGAGAAEGYLLRGDGLVTNLALSASALGTKYLNQIYIVSREVRDKTGAISVPADYSQLGELLIVQMILG